MSHNFQVQVHRAYTLLTGGGALGGGGGLNGGVLTGGVLSGAIEAPEAGIGVGGAGGGRR